MKILALFLSAILLTAFTSCCVPTHKNPEGVFVVPSFAGPSTRLSEGEELEFDVVGDTRFLSEFGGKRRVWIEVTHLNGESLPLNVDEIMMGNVKPYPDSAPAKIRVGLFREKSHLIIRDSDNPYDGFLVKNGGKYKIVIEAHYEDKNFLMVGPQIQSAPYVVLIEAGKDSKQ